MEINTRRNFFGKIAAMAALVTGAPKLFAQQVPRCWLAHTGSASSTDLAEIRLVAQAALTTRTMGSTTSPARVQ